MKKPLGKRITGFLAAAALAVTTIGASFVTPLTAKAATWRNALITVYDAEGKQKALANDPESNYYAVGLVTNGVGSTPKKDASGVWTNVVGWSMKQFHPEDLYSGQLGQNASDTVWESSTDWVEFPYNSFYAFGEDGSTKYPFSFNSDTQTFTLRVYRTIDASTTLDTLADCMDTSKARDSIPGYRFASDNDKYPGWKSSDTTKLAIIEYNTTYDVELEADGQTGITQSDNVYLRVEAKHGSGNAHYYVQKLDDAAIASGKISVQTASGATWYDINGNEDTHERISGNETLTASIVKCTNDNPVISNVTKLESCATFAEGEIVKGNKVSYAKQIKEEDDKSNLTEITDKITFKKVDAQNDHNFESILGGALNFGITADRFQQNNHLETNFAVNYYDPSGDAVDPDESGDFSGNFYISKFVDFPAGETTISDKTPALDDTTDAGKIFVGTKYCKNPPILHLDSYNRIKDDRTDVAVVVEDPAAMSNSVMEPNIAYMKNMSAELAAHTPNVTPLLVSGSLAIVDTTNYADDATIYIDGDLLAPYAAKAGGLKLRFKEDQTLVFNVKDTDKITLGQYNYTVVTKDGDEITTDSASESFVNSNTEGSKNYLHNLYATRSVVWNLASATDIRFENTTGIFLIPQENSVADIATTSSGWIVSDGFVKNTGGEWHFLYSGLSGSVTNLNVSKTDITGEHEVDGATLRILDENGNVVHEWVSESKLDKTTNKLDNTQKLVLVPGKYSLVETGDEIEYNGETYKVVSSKVDFEIVDSTTTAYTYNPETGKYEETTVKGAKVVIDENSKNNKEAFTEDTENGYFEKVNANTIKVCDAEKSDVEELSVSISKVDIADGKEVAGATIQILDADGEVVESWTSGTKAHKITGLTAGAKYTLRETVAPDGYTVATETTFSVSETGKVTTTGTVTDKGVILVEDAKTSVKISKVDIADGKEVAGATIQILDADGRVVESWTSGTKAHEITGLKTGVTYTLRETVAPDGYTVATDTTFSISETGKVTSTGSVTADGVLLVEDAKTSVKISKVDIADGNELEGAHIQILDAEGNVVEEWDSTTEAHEIKGLKTGVEYTLRETVAPEGYAIASETVFTLDKNGKVTSSGTVTEDGALLIEDAKTSVTVSKVDIADGAELEGAHIQILDAEGNVVEEWDSTTEAHEIKGLKTGVEYTLRETVAPEGYAIASETVFTLDKNGKVTSTGTVTEGGVLLVEDAMTSVKVSKVDIASGDEVEGAHIQILEGEKVVEEWDSTTEAHEIKGLKTGVTYTLRETVAPKGYKTASDTTFVIDSNGKVTSTATINKDGIILVEDAATDETVVTVSKKEINGKDELEGAELTITDKETGDVVKTWTSGKSAVKIALKDGTYTLEETGGEFKIGNKTYKVTDSTVEFTVEDGKVTSSKVTEGTIGKITVDGTNITVEDAFEESQDTELTISKKEINGKDELAGAELTIKDKSTGKVVKTWTSGKTAEKVTLSDGTYTLEETGGEFTVGNKTYKVTDSTVEFTVENGKVTSSKVTEGTIGKITVDGTNITVEDAFEESQDTELTISKKEINGKDELAGAELTIKDKSTGKVVKTWTSGKTAEKVTLSDGTYTLEETGGEFTVGNKTYKVTDSTVEFTVEDGKVTSSKVTEGTIGKITVDGTNITVEDAFEESQDTELTISKKEINGKDELAGAELTIKDKSTGKVVKTWTSGKTAEKVTLSDGTYTLEETGGEFTVGNKTYKVTDSTVEFTVENGKVTSSKVTEGTIGKITVDGTNITVEDAFEEKQDTELTISKKEINGKDELAGAELTIKDKSTGKVVKTWTSGKTAEKVTLSDGTYTLEETGGEFTVGNKTYKVTDSTVEFTVENGKVTSSKVTEGTIGKITVDGTNITVEDAFEEQKSDDEKKDEEDEKKDDEKSDDEKSDDEKKDEEQSDDEKKDEEQSDDEKKDDEQSDDEKKDDEQSDDEKKDDEQSDDEKKDDEQSDDEKKDDEQQSEEDEQQDEEQQSEEDEQQDEEQQSEEDEQQDEEQQSEEDEKQDEDEKSEDEEKQTDEDSDSDSDSQDDSQSGNGGAKTNDSSTSDGNDNDSDQTGNGGASTNNPTTGAGSALPAAMALACGAVIIFKKRKDD
ncbi:SpaA isopeptide-forming pilin-related protein [Ruminococcus sp. NK3A76]|uniref:SpaA isopeptide-forming pilin-related protein n=1 Tax=Ruminococcus sp. NK3A76 TaxID=877411 RepID=UPI00049052D9|nr:SpaA isopeptide-forming pilin-related protein [Ruminococcus sp. NK3A76]